MAVTNSENFTAPTACADILILGGGASGLFAAAVASRSDASVIILEKEARVGKKLLQTGNGRCNLSNAEIKQNDYNADLTAYFSRFGQKETEAFFASLGLEIYRDGEGRAYPLTNAASSVLDVLRFETERRGVCTSAGFCVKSVNNACGLWRVSDGSREFCAQNLFVACGGGEDGAQLLDALNVEYRPFEKTLCALRTQKPTGLDGLRADAEVSCGDFCQTGQIQFKKDALSGIVIFNLSAHLVRGGGFPAQICVNFLPNFNAAELVKRLAARRETLANEPCSRLFTGLLHSVLGINILSRCGIRPDLPAGALTPTQIGRLAKCASCCEFSVTGTTGENQAFCGGVPLDALSPNLEHKGRAGLYFIGEVADADGVCGGYNLQWAWTSAYLAAENACKKLK